MYFSLWSSDLNLLRENNPFRIEHMSVTAGVSQNWTIANASENQFSLPLNVVGASQTHLFPAKWPQELPDVNNKALKLRADRYISTFPFQYLTLHDYNLKFWNILTIIMDYYDNLSNTVHTWQLFFPPWLKIFFPTVSNHSLKSFEVPTSYTQLQ